MPRSKIFSIIHAICLVVLIIIMSFINLGILILLILVDLALQVVLANIEIRKVLTKVNEDVKNSKYDEVISFLVEKKDKVFFDTTRMSCLLNLCIIYMLNDEAGKAKELIINNPKLKDNKETYYVQFVLSVAENDETKIKELATKINSLPEEKYSKQKENTNNILEMINTKTYSEKVFNNTKYPILMRVCLKYLEGKDDVEDLHIEVSEEASVKTYKDLSRKQKVLKIVLIVLSIISIYVGLFFVAIAVESGSNLTYLESTYYQILNAWKFLIALPLPLASLAYGIYLYIKGYKFKGNLIFGIIFTGIILIYGIGFSSMKKTYLTDTMYLDKIEENVKINLPDDVFILTQDNTGTVQTNEQNVFINFVSSIRLEENLLLDEKWKDGFANMKVVPDSFVLLSTNFDKFLVYCVDTGEYDPTESEIDKIYYAIAYDEDDKVLLVNEYTFKGENTGN